MAILSKKMENILNLSALDRYNYFIRKVADFEIVWGLFSDGWAMMGQNVRQGIPFWPEAEFAELCATGEWAAYCPKKIELADFCEKWLPGMNNDGRIACVFPTQSEKPSFVEPILLLQQIVAELEQYT